MFTTFVSALLLATIVILVITLLAAEDLIRHHHAQKVDFFRRHPVGAKDIVFLGDSLTDGARWDELFPGFPIKNRGINGDTTRGVLRRLEDILPGKPQAIFLLIGTNDLPWYAYRTNRGILKTYGDILQRCKDESPQTKVFVQSLLPRHRRYARRIPRINAALERLAKEHGCTFINLHPHFATPKGALRPELTNDDLHLMGEGYSIWAEQIAPHVENLKKS